MERGPFATAVPEAAVADAADRREKLAVAGVVVDGAATEDDGVEMEFGIGVLAVSSPGKGEDMTLRPHRGFLGVLSCHSVRWQRDEANAWLHLLMKHIHSEFPGSYNESIWDTINY